MDLWTTLGVSRETGLIAAGLGLVAAVVLAGTIVLRRGRAERAGTLRIDDR
jgi:hypothetical protein